ncbi:hypothetical protein [Treponema primitia]|uniref:hypothetical protein n=1 Tax=Treponema primitia TaxID=88058 RepID=UPI0002555929|nr:hypothetical protein [Treponema primitia]
MKKTKSLVVMTVLALSVFFLLIACGEETIESLAEKNRDALIDATKATEEGFTATAKDKDGMDVPVSIQFGTEIILKVGEGESAEEGHYQWTIDEKTITLKGAGADGGDVTLGYVINDDKTLSITSGLDKIKGAENLEESLVSNENPALAKPAEEATKPDSGSGDVKDATVYQRNWQNGSDQLTPVSGNATVSLVLYKNDEDTNPTRVDIGTITKGKLSFTLPAESKFNTYLATLSSEPELANLKISNPAAKALTLGGGFALLNNAGQEIGDLRFEKDTTTGNDDITYWYFDRDVKITGTVIQEAEDEDDWSGTITINIDAKKGWNKVRNSETGNEKTRSFTSTITIWTGSTSDYKWVYEQHGSNSGLDSDTSATGGELQKVTGDQLATEFAEQSGGQVKKSDILGKTFQEIADLSGIGLGFFQSLVFTDKEGKNPVQGTTKITASAVFYLDESGGEDPYNPGSGGTLQKVSGNDIAKVLVEQLKEFGINKTEDQILGQTFSAIVENNTQGLQILQQNIFKDANGTPVAGTDKLVASTDYWVYGYDEGYEDNSGYGDTTTGGGWKPGSDDATTGSGKLQRITGIELSEEAGSDILGKTFQDLATIIGIPFDFLQYTFFTDEAGKNPVKSTTRITTDAVFYVLIGDNITGGEDSDLGNGYPIYSEPPLVGSGKLQRITGIELALGFGSDIFGKTFQELATIIELPFEFLQLVFFTDEAGKNPVSSTTRITTDAVFYVLEEFAAPSSGDSGVYPSPSSGDSGVILRATRRTF